MRELLFTLTYDQGCNAVADTLAKHPEVMIRSLSLHVTPDSLWRVDHAAGPSSTSLNAIKETFLTSEYYADCLVTDECGAIQQTEVLEHNQQILVLYSYWERTPDCASVPHIALNTLGDGTLFETRHEGRAYTWRIIHSGTGDISAFVDAVDAAVGDCAEMEIIRLSDAAAPTGSDADALAPKQETALRVAVEHGYYETPRKVDAGELAGFLGVPRSTLTYRLRRAEAHLAKRYHSEESITEYPGHPA